MNKRKKKQKRKASPWSKEWGVAYKASKLYELLPQKWQKSN